MALGEAISGRFSPRKESDSIWNSEHDSLLFNYSITVDDVLTVGKKLIEAKPDIEKVFTKP